MIVGPDVSGYQGATINWRAVKASGRSFAWAKCTEGTGFVDSTYAGNHARAVDAGLMFGAYHFARPDLRTNPVDEANYFLQNANIQHGDMVALDIEVGAGDLTRWVIGWLQHIEANIGRKPWFYTYLSFLGHFNRPAISPYPLWLADYGGNPGNGWQMWQYTDNESVPGIGPCDGSRFEGSVDDLKRVSGISSAPTPPPPPLEDTMNTPTKLAWARMMYILIRGGEPSVAEYTNLASAIHDDGSNLDEVFGNTLDSPEGTAYRSHLIKATQIASEWDADRTQMAKDIADIKASIAALPHQTPGGGGGVDPAQLQQLVSAAAQKVGDQVVQDLQTALSQVHSHPTTPTVP